MGTDQQLETLAPEEVEEVKRVGAVIDEGEVEPGTMRIDLHCHTEASPDCITPISLFPDRCHERLIRIQAITDHDTIWGAQKLQALVAEQGIKGLTIIVGEEITTRDGEIIGLFLTEKIEPGLSAEATVARIKAQGGLVLLPHGFDPLKYGRLRPEARERIRADVDLVETFNARVSQPRWNQAAVTWAEEHGVLMSAGSDAHTLTDVGSAWVEAPVMPIHSPQDLLRALAGGKPVGEWTHPIIAFAYKMWDQVRRRLGKS